MSEQKTAKRNWHAIVGANGMCECGIDAAGVVTTCGQLHQAELGVSPGDLRARIEQLRGQKPEPSVIPSSPYMDGWDAALDVVLRLLDGSKDAGSQTRHGAHL